MQDPNPPPWGALDRYQAHFIVRGAPERDSDALARAVLETRGRFGARRAVSVRWVGGRLADALNADAALCARVAALPPAAASVLVEPTGRGVRIRAGWSRADSFGITREEFEAYDAIAGHVRSLAATPSTSPAPAGPPSPGP